MKTTYAFRLTIILAACLCFPACTDDLPAAEKAAAVELRISEGWWVRINSDGSGSYGFGVLPSRIEVIKGTFAFEGVLEEIQQVYPQKPKNAEEPYMAVSYWQEGSTSAYEHRPAQDLKLMAKLFILARYNAAVPSNEIEKDWHGQIESFWTKSPPISPKKRDAGDDK